MCRARRCRSTSAANADSSPGWASTVDTSRFLRSSGNGRGGAGGYRPLEQGRLSAFVTLSSPRQGRLPTLVPRLAGRRLARLPPAERAGPAGVERQVREVLEQHPVDELVPVA